MAGRQDYQGFTEPLLCPFNYTNLPFYLTTLLLTPYRPTSEAGLNNRRLPPGLAPHPAGGSLAQSLKSPPAQFCKTKRRPCYQPLTITTPL